MKVKSESEVAQSCPTLSDPVDCWDFPGKSTGVGCHHLLRDCFHVLAIVNCAGVNNGIHVSFSILVSSGCMPSSGIAGSYDCFIPSFLKEFPYHLP